jgi:hypothetical protein
MLNSTVLEVAIGMVFCYASVALIASSVYEALASWLSLRSNTLLTGVKNLLNGNDTANHALLLGIYNHALTSPLGNGKAEKLEDIAHKPSYIEPKNFALAMIETLQSVPGDFAALGNDIDKIQDPQIQRLLRGMYDTAAGDLTKMQTNLAARFDSGMNRVSGSYKRQSQLWCFVIALAIAILFNIDSFYLFKILWQHPGIVAKISNTHYEISDAMYAELQQLPIGWGSLKDKSTIELVAMPLGWLITGSASLFGGPFWFDLLKTLINLRGTGVKPPSTENKTEN